MSFLPFLILLAVVQAKVYFVETFSNGLEQWVLSEAKPSFGTWEVSPGSFFADSSRSRGIKTTEDSHFYSIAAPFTEVFDHEDKDFIVQFSVKFEQDIDCGGGYVKVMPPGSDLKNFDGSSEYNIMFGPDICGGTHAILNYKEKNHLIKTIISPRSDQLTHLYTFIIHPNQTYSIQVDQKEEASGSIFDAWDLLPPSEIQDPKAKKPADWVDEPSIPDPEAVKPSDWTDEPEFIEDVSAIMPEDWDAEEDGDWVKPTLPNPKYKGEWKPPQIPNPQYKGHWSHPMIPNPHFELDENVYAYKSAFIGFDLWQVKAGTIFDNIIITDSIEEAETFAEQTWKQDLPLEKKAKESFDKIKEVKEAADTDDEL